MALRQYMCILWDTCAFSLHKGCLLFFVNFHIMQIQVCAYSEIPLREIAFLWFQIDYRIKASIDEH